MDYLSTKVDFFKDYQDEAEEAEAAVACIASNSSSSLSAEVARLRDSFSSTVSGLAWEDSVKTEFDNYVSQCTEAFNEVINSISAYFAPAEQAYQKMDTALKELKTANEAYQTAYGNGKPKSSDAKFNGVETTIENGVSKSTSVFYREKYEAAVEAWKTKVSEAAGKCIDLIVEIEDCKTQLLNTESNPLSMTASAVGAAVGQLLSFEIPEMAQVASAAAEAATALAGTVAAYVEANNSKLYSFSKWNDEFYLVSDIKSSSKQPDNFCLYYANAFCEQILSHNGYDYTQNGNDGNPYFYSSKDKSEIKQIMVREILAGRPVTLEVNGTSKNCSGNRTFEVIVNGEKTTETYPVRNRHFVSVVGIRKGADLSNLRDTDFVILDPTSGTGGLKQLGTGNGGQQRDLCSAKALTYNPYNTDYSINVYSDVNYSEEYENTTLASKGMTQNKGGSPKVTFKG